MSSWRFLCSLAMRSPKLMEPSLNIADGCTLMIPLLAGTGLKRLYPLFSRKCNICFYYLHRKKVYAETDQMLRACCSLPFALSGRDNSRAEQACGQSDHNQCQSMDGGPKPSNS